MKRHTSNKQRIILASISEQENYLLKRKIDPVLTDLGPIQFMSVGPKGLPSAIEAHVSIVILNIPAFTYSNQTTIQDTRQAGYHGPLLVVSKVDNPEMIKEIKSLENVILLEKPYEIKDLQGIVRKFILAANVAQRIHRRYNIIQPAEVEIVSKNTKAVSTVFNLSRGGCYFEFPRKADVKTGDFLNMTIELSEMNRIYAMPAKVVWTQPRGQAGGFGVGVEFIGRGSGHNQQIGL